MSTRRNIGYNLAYRVFSMALPIVTAPYLSRVVGKDGVGLYSYTWGISTLFVLLGTFGLTDYGVRAIAREKEDPLRLNRTFSAIYRMQLVVAGAALLGYLVYALFIAGAEKVLALHMTMMSVACLVNLDWALMGLDQFKPIALKNTLVKLMAAACVFLFVKSAEDLWIYALVWSGSTLVGSLLTWTNLRGRVKFVAVPWKEAWRHLLPCMRLFLSVVAVNVYRTMDKVMVGAISGMGQNGLYENAEKIIFSLASIFSAVSAVRMPKMSSLYAKGDVAAVRRGLGVILEFFMCFSTMTAFGLYVQGEDFAVLFYGEAFRGSGLLLRYLGFSLILIALANAIRTHWILPRGKDHLVVISVTAGAVVNLVVNLMLIPSMGAMGAVIGTLAAESTVPLVQFLFLRREVNYRRNLRVWFFDILSAWAAAQVGLWVKAVVHLSDWWELVVQLLAMLLIYELLIDLRQLFTGMNLLSNAILPNQWRIRLPRGKSMSGEDEMLEGEEGCPQEDEPQPPDQQE